MSLWLRQSKMPLLRCLCALALFFAAGTLRAHQTGESYLNLRVDGTTLAGTLDLGLLDLDHAVHLDADGNGAITYDELKAKYPAIDAYVAQRLHLRMDGKEAALHIHNHEVANHSDGIYSVVEFTVTTTGESRKLEVECHLFLDFNPQHRSLMQLEYHGEQRVAVFNSNSSTQNFILSQPTAGEQFRDFVVEGVSHIWHGYDHILFLLALLFPAVLCYADRQWQPVTRFRPAFINVLKIVTAFTLAHSLTLTLAALELIKLPSRLVESAIAASVILASVNNLLPFFQGRAWMVAFGFGLVHGFGFANVLGDLGLSRGALAIPLVSFNLGVELGQLAIVAVFLPIAFALRHSKFYQGPVFRFGSALIILVSATWMAERIFDFKVLPI